MPARRERRKGRATIRVELTYAEWHEVANAMTQHAYTRVNDTGRSRFDREYCLRDYDFVRAHAEILGALRD